MIPQGYELWLAEDLDDGGAPLIGRIIGWHPPAKVDSADDAAKITPIVAYDCAGDRTGFVGLANATIFFGSTKEEVTQLAAEHRERQEQPELEARMKDMEAQQRRRAWDMARDDAEKGELDTVKECVATALDRLAPRLRPVAESAEWTLTAPREIEVKVPRRRDVELLPIYEQHISRIVNLVLGEGWTVKITRAGFLRSLQ
ncbi:hypothetical protein [Micromonospora sp. NPDC005173]|uniref:hypothetical protein n=1 Tax=Micromonospora sp. NPDC005173 TaxID=3157165 RepID=UPI0033ACE3CA